MDLPRGKRKQTEPWFSAVVELLLPHLEDNPSRWGVLVTCKRVYAAIRDLLRIDQPVLLFASWDGAKLASGGDRTIKLWDGAGPKKLCTLVGHKGCVRRVAFSPDGLKVASCDPTIKLWDAITGTELCTLGGHKDCVNSVVFAPDGEKLASCSNDRTIKLWDTTGKELCTLGGHKYAVNSVVFAPDGEKLASCSDDGTIKLWDTTGKELCTLGGHKDRVWSVAFSPDSHKVASASWDCTVKLWDATAGTELCTLGGHKGGVWSVTFSPDSQKVASASSDKTVKLWDAVAGTELCTLGGHFPGQPGCICTGDLNYLDHYENRDPKCPLGGHKDLVMCVVFAPDGTKLASCSMDKTIKLWDVAAQKELCTLGGHKYNSHPAMWRAPEMCWAWLEVQLSDWRVRRAAIDDAAKVADAVDDGDEKHVK